MGHKLKKLVKINRHMPYDIAMEAITKEKIYSKEQIKSIILGSSNANISDVAVHKRINKMISLGKLFRVGNGQYAFLDKQKFDYSLTNGLSLDVLDKLVNHFDKTAEYIIYESTLLNRFLNHLIARSTVIVEAEKDLVESIFWFLKEKDFKNVLLNPSENENFIYNPYDGSGVIVKTMVSKSPIDNKRHKTTIEKLVVDIVCDKRLNMFYEGAEIPHMVEDILTDYVVKIDSVRNYAKRRNCFDKFMKYVPDGLEGAFND